MGEVHRLKVMDLLLIVAVGAMLAFVIVAANHVENAENREINRQIHSAVDVMIENFAASDASRQEIVDTLIEGQIDIKREVLKNRQAWEATTQP